MPQHWKRDSKLQQSSPNPHVPLKMEIQSLVVCQHQHSTLTYVLRFLRAADRCIGVPCPYDSVRMGSDVGDRNLDMRLRYLFTRIASLQRTLC